MSRWTRRDFLRLAGGTAAALAGLPGTGKDAAAAEEPYVTCFYQFTRTALQALSGPDALPNGPGYLHLFSHSHPGMNPHPDTAKAVQALGSSFKYALALDVHKYPGWQTAPEEQLRTWAKEFRAQALDARGPADYFAFNEMPTTGASTPNLRAQAAKWVRFLHDPGEGPKLRGVFYFTERNLNPKNWQGDADDFWTALDETCDLVVGEHYHSYEFALGKTREGLAEHLFPLPKWLEGSERPAQKSIAARKYAALHSSYYGTEMTGWAGVQSPAHGPEELEKYLEHVLGATRSSRFGARRVAFGPLAAKGFDPQVLPILARVLGKDARR
jgi:hypothetical protein